MSKISTIYDEVRTRVSGVLTTHTELNNPYFLTDADIQFEKAFGVTIGPADNTNRVICNEFTIRRDFPVIIARRVFMTHRDISTRITVEKNLFEDQYLLIKQIEGTPSSDNIISIGYNNDNGLEFVDGDRWGFLLLTTNLSVEYFENT